MKKSILSIVIAILCSALVLCACGAKETATGQVSPATQPAEADTQASTQAQTEADTQPETQPATQLNRGDADLALTALCGLMESQNTQQASQYVIGTDEAGLQTLVEHYPKMEGQVTVSMEGSFEDYDIFSYQISYEGQTFETGMMLVLLQEDGYKICMDQQIQQNMVNHCQCSTCNGAGGANLGGYTCGICGGTGQQYYPNMYFDGTMWQGQYMACSGCAGTGQTGSNWVPCVVCGGDGWQFQ